MRIPQERERPAASRHDPGWRYRVRNTRPDPSVRGGQERTSESSVVSLREGNGAQRDVRQESDRSVVPKKRGNLSRGNPVEGRDNVSCHETRYGRTVMEPLEGNMTDSLKFGTEYPQQRRIANTVQNHTGRAGCWKYASPETVGKGAGNRPGRPGRGGPEVAEK